MVKFVIKGSRPLRGEISVCGMKNAATPIIAASLMAKEESVISNIPEIQDVISLLEIIQSLGVKVSRQGNTVKIMPSSINLNTLDQKKVQAMRSSVLLIAPLLSIFKEVRMPQPGGCIIGNRPLDTHLYVFRELGAEIQRKGDEYILKTKGLKGNNLVLPEFSVTATENAVMAAVLAEGKTMIKIAACEPHIQDLCCFLNKMGAKIEGIGTHTLKIEGVKKLSGTEYTIIPDQIEAGTFAIAGAVTRGNLIIKNIIPEHLDIVVMKLREAGVSIEIQGNQMRVKKSGSIKPFRIQSMPYPGFPTDLQAPFSILATQAKGTSLIHDPLYEARLSHIKELTKMGANAVVCDPHRVLISGPTSLYGREIESPDLRAGVTLIMAGLIAQGETIISHAEIIDRGYAEIEKRLNSVGADIKRIKE